DIQSLLPLSLVSSDTPTDDLLPLSLHDALPILHRGARRDRGRARPGAQQPPAGQHLTTSTGGLLPDLRGAGRRRGGADRLGPSRSEEHTSELQSRFDLVCRLLLEKKNQQ